tara:strand:- start:1710 stop:2138 length:429 start_codon:yes stop_codon:yes gene_type:complete
MVQRSNKKSRGRKVKRSNKKSRGRKVKRSSKKSKSKSKKIYGGTKTPKKVKNKKVGVRSNKIKKEPSVKAQGWTLHSGPKSELIYPAYFKSEELKKVEEDHKKVQEDLAAAEYLHSQRPQPQPRWEPSRLPPPEVELMMPGF